MDPAHKTTYVDGGKTKPSLPRIIDTSVKPPRPYGKTRRPDLRCSVLNRKLSLDKGLMGI